MSASAVAAAMAQKNDQKSASADSGKTRNQETAQTTVAISAPASRPRISSLLVPVWGSVVKFKMLSMSETANCGA